jgi:hypothetical protein
MTIAYKVVQLNETGRRTSVTHAVLPPEWTLIYTPGIPVTPLQQGSKIFVFQTVIDVKNYLNKYLGHLEVWECECENLTPGGQCVALEWNKTRQLITLPAFWSKAPVVTPGTTPPGTALADAVTLTKLLQDRKALK